MPPPTATHDTPDEVLLPFHVPNGQIDSRAPRFAQTVTAVTLLSGIGFQRPGLVFATAILLGAAVASRWNFDFHQILWRRLVRPAVGVPASFEPAAPHRFAKLLGATGTTVASLLLALGHTLFGYALAMAVALLAAVAAATGFCLGCRLYRHVRYLDRLNVL